MSFAEPPEIDLDASMRKLVTVRAGCPIRLFAIVRGRPAPKVTWRKVGIDNVVRKGQVDRSIPEPTPLPRALEQVLVCG